MITEFQGKYRWLSNFWMSPMIIDGKTFVSNEQWYVYNKTTDEKARKHIMRLSKSRDIKRMGRTVKLRDDWDSIKVNAMWLGLYAKFTQNKELKEKLIATGDQQLIEGNRWGDTFWGIDLRTNEGENCLGKLLMKLRSELKS